MRPHFKKNGISISERLSPLGKTVAFLFVMTRTLIMNVDEQTSSRARSNSLGRARAVTGGQITSGKTSLGVSIDLTRSHRLRCGTLVTERRGCELRQGSAFSPTPDLTGARDTSPGPYVVTTTAAVKRL